MISIRKGTVDTLQLTLKQVVDNKREDLNLVGATVTFEAKQVDPAPLKGDPNPPKVISRACTVIGASVVTCGLTSTDTNTAGKYRCTVKIEKGGSVIYNKYPFEMVIWEL